MTSTEAFLYAKENPSLRHNVSKYIRSSEVAFLWVKQWPEDKDIMRERTTDSENAYEWAIEWLLCEIELLLRMLIGGLIDSQKTGT
jgi:hypothetical protein